MGTPIKKHGLSIRAQKVLIRAGIETYEHLATTTDGQLLEIRNCGEGTLSELRQLMASGGFAKSQPELVSLQPGLEAAINRLAFSVTHLARAVQEQTLKLGGTNG